MALESSLWQRNKRNFILFIIAGAVVLISALALKAYRSRKRFNTYPHSTLPLTIPNSNSSIPSTEVELRSSSSPREQEKGEKAVAQGQKQQVPQIGEQAVKRQSKQELQGKEQEQLRLSASLGFLPEPQEPGAQTTQQNVSAAPAPVKPAPIPQAQLEKDSDLPVKLVLFALSFLFTIFFMGINRGLLGIVIIVVLVPGFGCFIAAQGAIKLWSSQRKFSVHRQGVVVEGQITDRRVIPDPRAIRRSFSFTTPRRFTTYYIKYSYTYDGKTYSRWLEVPRKRYKFMHNKSSVAVSLLSNMPTESYLKGYNQIRRDAAYLTSFAIFCLGLILSFVFFSMPDISYLIKGDPPAAPSSIIPDAIPNTFLTSTALCTGGSIDPSCGAKQVFDDYCLELSNWGETPPYLYLTPTLSKYMPGRTEIHGCMHKQVYCPTDEFAYSIVEVHYANVDSPTIDRTDTFEVILVHTDTGWKISKESITPQPEASTSGTQCQR